MNSQMQPSAHCTGKPTAPLVTLSIKNDPFAVREALIAIDKVLQSIQASHEFQTTSQIVLAEALNNIVEHAYGAPGMGKIELTLCLLDDHIQVELRDSGKPMPDRVIPSADSPRTGPAPETLPEGGFGWKIIDDLTQDLNYRRNPGGNVLRFRLAMAQMA